MGERSANGSWKGGLSYVRKADDILSLPRFSIEYLKEKIIANTVKETPSRCWIWQGSVWESTGRPYIKVGVRIIAARVCFVLFYGRIGNLYVLHTCDNILCLNPAHLWLGSPADNSQDMVDKGRHRNGSM